MRFLIAVAALASACSNASEAPTAAGGEPAQPTASNAAKGTGPKFDSAIARNWLRLSHDDRRERDCLAPIDRKFVVRVADRSIDRATSMLLDTPWKRLSRAEAEKLIGRPIESPESNVLVLLRGVDMARGDTKEESTRQVDGIDVFEIGGRTIVVTTGWRYYDYAINPCPIVAAVSSEPKDVFVELYYSHPTHAIQQPYSADH